MTGRMSISTNYLIFQRHLLSYEGHVHVAVCIALGKSLLELDNMALGTVVPPDRCPAYKRSTKGSRDT
jgi:hypothetical protein